MAGSIDPIEALKAAPAEINPALLLAWELRQREIAGGLGLRELLPLQGGIEAAIQAGEASLELTDKIVAALRAAKPIESPQVPLGF